MTDSWRTLAYALAERLSHQARCSVHSQAEADPDNCPFCADRDAYQRFTAKARLDAKEGTR